jgi:hypothetical protein
MLQKQLWKTIKKRFNACYLISRTCKLFREQLLQDTQTEIENKVSYKCKALFFVARMTQSLFGLHISFSDPTYTSTKRVVIDSCGIF